MEYRRQAGGLSGLRHVFLMEAWDYPEEFCLTEASIRSGYFAAELVSREELEQRFWSSNISVNFEPGLNGSCAYSPLGSAGKRSAPG